jgi:exopolyphosphatase/guanosine-5'-triphosphate,3'-diphosphate pyrophosphatase
MIAAPVARPRTRPERLGAIDVGSNSIRLLVADWDPAAGLSVVDEVKDQPRLATGLAATGRLDDEAVARAMAALERMRDVAERRGVRRLAAVATSAVREADNGEAFIRRVQTELGIPLRVIDAETEARLSYNSVAHHFPLDHQRTVVADIGGGSLEIIGAVRGVLDLTLSLPLGAVRLTEANLLDRKNTRKAVVRLREKVERRLRKSATWKPWRGAQVVGSGGSFTNLGRISAARRGLEVSSVHGMRVTTAEVEHLLDWLAAMRPEQRRQVPGLNPQRADIILAGLAVTAELLERLDSPELIVSAFGLREGLLLEMIGGDAPERRDPTRLAREFAQRCQCDMRHVEQVRALALQLFDRLAEPLGAAAEERHLLETAAILHDVGQLMSYRKRHLYTMDLILHAERLNLSPRERQLVALIARFHRKEAPAAGEHPEFAGLTGADRQLVRRLAALLRIADGLDRGYTSVVEKVRLRLSTDRLLISLVPATPGSDLSLERWGAQRRVDLLAKLLERDVRVH